MAPVAGTVASLAVVAVAGGAVAVVAAGVASADSLTVRCRSVCLVNLSSFWL